VPSTKQLKSYVTSLLVTADHSCRKTTILKYTKLYGTFAGQVVNEVLRISSWFLIRTVALQMPEGLLMFACTIADILEQYPSHPVFHRLMTDFVMLRRWSWAMSHTAHVV
jgi:hypothetical protein